LKEKIVDSGTTIVSKKYALAFLNLFGSRLSPVDIEHIDQAMRFLFEHQQVLGLLKISGISNEDKRRVLYKFAQKYKLPALFNHVIDLLVEHKRAFILPHVLEMIIFVFQQREGIDTFKISSSHPLEKEVIAILEHFLQQKTGQRIRSSYTIDESLIAGIRMQSSTFLWEYSVAQQLRELQVPLIA
jgi:ATP synthase F1 delta subunit